MNTCMYRNEYAYACMYAIQSQSKNEVCLSPFTILSAPVVVSKMIFFAFASDSCLESAFSTAYADCRHAFLFQPFEKAEEMTHRRHDIMFATF